MEFSRGQICPKEKTMITVQNFQQWSIVIPDGTVYDCDTLEEVMQMVNDVLPEGTSLKIRKNSREGWFRGKEVAAKFNKETYEKTLDHQPNV
jgi:hypothetical protein